MGCVLIMSIPASECLLTDLFDKLARKCDEYAKQEPETYTDNDVK